MLYFFSFFSSIWKNKAFREIFCEECEEKKDCNLENLDFSDISFHQNCTEISKLCTLSEGKCFVIEIAFPTKIKLAS